MGKDAEKYIRLPIFTLIKKKIKQLKFKLFATILIILLFGCKNDISSELPFLLHKPIEQQENRLYPLVICLHDADGRGSDNTGRGSEAYMILTDSLQQSKNPSYILIPQCPIAKKWVNCYWTSGNYDMSILEITNELEIVNELIDDIVEKYNIDRSRIYLTGQSMGSYGVWDLSVRKPNFFAAAIMISGGGDINTVVNLLELPMKMYNSEKDPLVPSRGAKSITQKFKEFKSHHFTYKEYEGAAHNIWHRVWRSEKIIEWMFSKKRSSN